MGILLKCIPEAAEHFDHMFIGYVRFYFMSVQFMQFPVLDFGLVVSGSRPFICVYTPHVDSRVDIL